MRQSDLMKPGRKSSDPWVEPQQVLNLELLRQLGDGPIAGDNDLESARWLTRLVSSEFEKFGTDGRQMILTEDDSLDVLAVLRKVVGRHGIRFKPPFDDLRSFRMAWIQRDMSGSGGWALRRQFVAEQFGPIEDTLREALDLYDDQSLAEPVSPVGETGWPRVDREIAELRQRFRTAMTPEDYRDVGNRAVAVTEALALAVFDAKRHWEGPEPVPAPSATKNRLDAFVNTEAPGPANAELRKLVRSTIEFAQAVKHRAEGTRRDAGIAADAVIMLANLLRRLDGD